MAVQPTPVTVNFDVNVNASHSVTIFEDSPVTLEDVIVCSTTLPVSNLYVSDAADEALFEFQGQDAEIAGRVLVGEASFGTTARAATFASDLAAILTNDNNVTDALDATSAQPFNEANKYTSSFKEYTSFGRVALAAYAHHLFGHVQATAAITNDSDIVEHMNGEGVGKANICSSLVAAIYGMISDDATDVVKQVIGQDSSRTRDVDNDLTSPDSWQRLKWIGGDKIYLQVTLQRPTTVQVADGDDDVQQYVPASSSIPANIKYSFEITLEEVVA